MLRLLLDEQISGEVARGLRRKDPRLPVHSLAEWQEGRFLSEPDWMLLEAAAREGLSLVTYDRATIPPLLKTWAEEGRSHGGVIFIDQRTIPSSDFGSLIRAIIGLYAEGKDWPWRDRVIHLRR